MSLEEVELELSDGSLVGFINYPLNKPFECLSKEVKDIDPDLENILLNPQDYPEFHAGLGKIFLGFGSDQPSDNYRFPVWFPVGSLTTHFFSAGSTGSGKTSLASRLIAGSLQHFGTVIVGEVKSGTKGFSKGSAFTELSKYLSQRLDIPTYRWPRGNCWFNPLKYLTKKDERLGFLNSISKQLNTSSDLLGFADKAAEIANCILEFMAAFVPNDKETLRTLVDLLGDWTRFEKTLTGFIRDIQQNQSQNPNSKIAVNKLLEIKQALTQRDFFRLEKSEFINTRAAVMALVSALSDDDLLYYSEPHAKGRDGLPLQELLIDNVLYNRSLIVISQPQQNPSSKFVGPLFWDTLRRRVLDLGIGRPERNGKMRENILAILDETNELPVGDLGSSLGFLRQYCVGIVEITPCIDSSPHIKDANRWNYCQQTCQTFLSLTPALEEVTQFIYKNLPNQPQNPFMPDIQRGERGQFIPSLEVNREAFQSGKDNPGVSPRSLNHTGKRTALLYLRDIQGIFWLDLESSLLGKLDKLLKDANSPNATVYVKKAVDYALGLAMEFNP
jgi:hypothetical protein